jgi:uncharacterized protein YdaT
MQPLPWRRREKVIEIANAFLAEGYDDGRAIRIAIAQTRRWPLRPQGKLNSTENREAWRCALSTKRVALLRQP